MSTDKIFKWILAAIAIVAIYGAVQGWNNAGEKLGKQSRQPSCKTIGHVAEEALRNRKHGLDENASFEQLSANYDLTDEGLRYFNEYLYQMPDDTVAMLNGDSIRFDFYNKCLENRGGA